MKVVAAVVLAAAVFTVGPAAQETKKVPDDSVRVFLPGCTKGYVFTVGPRTIETPGRLDIREGTHIRMNGPRKLMNDIKAHEGSMIELTGLMKKGQYLDGVGIGGGVSVGPGGSSAGGRPAYQGNQAFIDVEGWRQIEGSCPTK